MPQISICGIFAICDTFVPEMCYNKKRKRSFLGNCTKKADRIYGIINPGIVRKREKLFCMGGDQEMEIVVGAYVVNKARENGVITAFDGKYIVVSDTKKPLLL